MLRWHLPVAAVPLSRRASVRSLAAVVRSKLLALNSVSNLSTANPGLFVLIVIRLWLLLLLGALLCLRMCLWGHRPIFFLGQLLPSLSYFQKRRALVRIGSVSCHVRSNRGVHSVGLGRGHALTISFMTANGRWQNTFLRELGTSHEPQI
jgi:hypothetical protein